MASGYSDLSEIRKDNRFFNTYPKPPKINLLNEKPRRESLIEQQLTGIITRPNFQQPNVSQQPQCQYQQQQQVGPPVNQPLQQQQQLLSPRSHELSNEFNLPSTGTTNYTIVRRSDHGYSLDHVPGSSCRMISSSGGADGGSSGLGGSGYSQTLASHQYHAPASTQTVTRTVKTTTLTSDSLGQHPVPVTSNIIANSAYPISAPNRGISYNYSGSIGGGYPDLAAELADKEAKLKREIAYMNLHQNQWSRPRQTREPRREPTPKLARSDQRWVRECPSGPASRSTSRASSTRSTTEADLLEKAAKLLQDVEELERKPLNRQQILIESGAKASASKPLSSANPNSQEQPVSSIHTAIINVPNHEIDNKSPLPFAFDNFSTLGIRGNIASVGAAPPETPYPPIFPIIKRTPSPNLRRG